ncbi:MAG: hypothetical protein HYX86_03150 [Chloroflexi bacterium]|nr:hypothetical protein [Chloroflexota bacterium]
MDIQWVFANLNLIITITLYLIGVVATLAGLWIILAKEYQTAMKQLASQAIKINGRAITQQDAVAPIIDSAAQLVAAINELVRTAAGIGAFLCIAGVLIILVAFWMTGTL